MERNDGKKLTVTAGLVAAAVIGLTVQQARGGRHTLTAEGAEQALVYGQLDANWVQSASNLIKAQPELAARLARISESNSIDDVRRGQALDALARAGSDAAQVALREVLASESVQADPIYPMLLARLGDLTTPSPQTLGFLQVEHGRAAAAGNGELAYAAQHTLDAAYRNRLAGLYSASARHARSATYLHNRAE